MKRIALAVLLLVISANSPASRAADATPTREYHVSIQGNDANDGSAAKPLKTISAASQLAQPGEVVTVHEGIYRERIAPPRGGESDSKRIVYQAAPGEKVVITGSEAAKNWVKVQDDTWKVTIPNAFFGKFNPYSDLIRGDWFNARNRKHHTGSVYLNGKWLIEAAKLDAVLQPAGATSLWFGEVDKDNTTIWAQFKGVDPNVQLVEINVRQAVFYPEKTGMNYITVRGFTMRHAATPWAPPTAEQIGLIGTNWSKGWIIENNDISYSKCSGVALGKHGDQFDNTSANSAEGYVKTIERAMKAGWNKETIGHHIVRNNHISHCEQTGVVGSMGCSFSTVTGNVIHDIHVLRLFGGAEMGGIKFHGAIDVEISRNHIYRTDRGIWLDWMNQGSRVTANLLHDNHGQDLFVEVNHGPFTVDNNILLSRQAVLSVSHGGAYIHNLIAGDIHEQPFDGRQTPFHKAHVTELGGLHDNPSGDDRYYNNLFVDRGTLRGLDAPRLPVWMDGNVFLGSAQPSKQEKDPLQKADFDPAIKLVEEADGFYLEGKFDKAWAAERTRKLVTTELLGKTAIAKESFENADGSPLRINTDYFGKARAEANPFPGPFELPEGRTERLKVWPVGAAKSGSPRP